MFFFLLALACCINNCSNAVSGHLLHTDKRGARQRCIRNSSSLFLFLIKSTHILPTQTPPRGQRTASTIDTKEKQYLVTQFTTHFVNCLHCTGPRGDFRADKVTSRDPQYSRIDKCNIFNGARWLVALV